MKMYSSRPQIREIDLLQYNWIHVHLSVGCYIHTYIIHTYIIHTYTHAHIHTYTHIHTHIHTYTHIHT